MHKKGVSVEFSLPLANPLRIKNNFSIQEETEGIVLFKNKFNLETTKLVNNQVIRKWMIGQKEVNLDNSNFFNFYVEKVTSMGVPVSNWIKVDEINYFRIFVIRSPDLTTANLVCRFKFKNDDGKWIRGKDSLPIPYNQELIDAWKNPGSVDDLGPKIFQIISPSR